MNDSSITSRGSLSLILAGGGSGGHLFPGIALAEELTHRDPSCQVLFVGSDRSIERTVLAETSWKQVVLPIQSASMAKRRPIAFAQGLATSYQQSLRLIDELRPRAVIGLGGFASVPVGLAARRRRVPLVLLEQNVVPGRATSLLSRFADRVCVSFDETRPFLSRNVRTARTGNPLRREILSRAARPQRERSTLLVLGGSQGAFGVNRIAVEALTRLKSQLGGLQIVHQTGERDLETVRAAYGWADLDAEVAPFFTDLPSRYAQARLVVSRAGATTLAELATFGCPAVLVPYPNSLREHQSRNAEWYAEAGGAVIVPEGPTAHARLAETLLPLLADPGLLAPMAHAMTRSAVPQAAQSIADLFLPRPTIAAAA